MRVNLFKAASFKDPFSVHNSTQFQKCRRTDGGYMNKLTIFFPHQNTLIYLISPGKATLTEYFECSAERQKIEPIWKEWWN